MPFGISSSFHWSRMDGCAGLEIHPTVNLGGCGSAHQDIQRDRRRGEPERRVQYVEGGDVPRHETAVPEEVSGRPRSTPTVSAAPSLSRSNLRSRFSTRPVFFPEEDFGWQQSTPTVSASPSLSRPNLSSRFSTTPASSPEEEDSSQPQSTPAVSASPSLSQPSLSSRLATTPASSPSNGFNMPLLTPSALTYPLWNRPNPTLPPSTAPAPVSRQSSPPLAPSTTSTPPDLSQPNGT